MVSVTALGDSGFLIRQKAYMRFDQRRIEGVKRAPPRPRGDATREKTQGSPLRPLCPVGNRSVKTIARRLRSRSVDTRRLRDEIVHQTLGTTSPLKNRPRA